MLMYVSPTLLARGPTCSVRYLTNTQIWQHIQPAMPTADVTVELSAGAGIIRLRLDWTMGVSHGSVKDLKHRDRAASIKSSTDSPSSPSRFSLKRNKTKEKE